MDRYLCVHGHFYQPPRENPWLEVVEQQDAAYPFHDWNERITVECYDPNTRARILDRYGRITNLVNNYARMSFNVGPTLLSWMADEAPATYAAILAADELSQQRCDGHGAAMAQVYNHAIMPLAHPRDARTQVVWGIRDFEHRFGRAPEGMWLAETAADHDTLELLAAEGVRFTVLSPYQAARVRPRSEPEGTWTEVGGGRIDPTMPYQVRLASGATIAVFFYDGPISQGVAFEGLLTDGNRFVGRLLEGFSGRGGPQLVNIATDGESYGHHHRHGEMALATALEQLDARDDVILTNYAHYLALFPPTHEVEIVEQSSWSCAHGVERWRSDCGCGAEPGLHQRWRAPLRDALDELRSELATRYEELAGELFVDVWAARDDYVDVVLDRDGAVAGFLARHARRPLDDEERGRALKLLEMQRHALLMFTSCGWFFAELSRPEPVQVLRYAARAIQLARELTGADDLEATFVSQLARAESNDPRLGDGQGIYDQGVKPGVTDLEQVAAHFAISSLSWEYGASERIGAYEVVRQDEERHRAGRSQLGIGRLVVRSVVTGDEGAFEYGVLHLGDHTFACGVRPRADDAAYQRMCALLDEHFETADFPAVIRTIDHELGGRSYSLRTLFRDEQRRILDQVLATTLEEVEASYRGIYRGRAPLMRYLSDLHASLPLPLKRAAEVVLNAELEAQLATTGPDPARVRGLLDEAGLFAVHLDEEGLAHTLSTSVARLASRIEEYLAGGGGEALLTFEPRHAGALQRVSDLIQVIEMVSFEVDLAPAQDVLWRLVTSHFERLRVRAAGGDAAATRWLEELTRAAIALDVAVPSRPEGVT